jgi:uncharacterized membrane protein YkvA (DUF1232 family)
LWDNFAGWIEGVLPIDKTKIIYIVVGVLYLISPLDFLPDLIPILGRLDDLLVLAFLYYRYRKLYHSAQGAFRRATGGDQSRSKDEESASGSRHEEKEERVEKLTPHQVLGIAPGASAEEIDKAYKTLAMQYHPDRVNHLGKEFRELAHEKMVEIQQAYDTLRR